MKGKRVAEDSRKEGGIFSGLRSLIDKSARESAAAIKGKSADIASAAARVMTSMGRDSGAESIYQKILQEKPDDTASLFGMAGIFLDRGSASEGLDFFEQALATGGRPPEPLLLKALRQAVDFKRIDDSVRWLDLAEPSGGKFSAGVLRISAEINGLAGNLEKRRENLSSLVFMGSADAQESAEAVRGHVESGIASGLVEIALAAIETAPSSKTAVVTCLEGAVETLPEAAMLALAKIWAAENDFRRAGEWRLKLAAVTGGKGRLEQLRSALNFFSEAGAVDREIEILRSIIEMDPADSETALALAERLDRSKDPAGAIRVLEKSRLCNSPDSRSPRVFKSLVQGLFRAERYRECLEVVDSSRGAEETGDSAERERIRFIKGRCLSMTGRFAEAREILAYVLSCRSPGDHEVAAMAEVLLATGEIVGLAELLDRAQSETARETVVSAAMKLFGTAGFEVPKNDGAAGAKLFRAIGARFSQLARPETAAEWYGAASSLSGLPEDRMALAMALGSGGEQLEAARVFSSLFKDFRRIGFEGWSYDEFSPYLAVLERLGAGSPGEGAPGREPAPRDHGPEDFSMGAEYSLLAMFLGRKLEALAAAESWLDQARRANAMNPGAVPDEVLSQLGCVAAVSLIREGRGSEARDVIKAVPLSWNDRWLILKTMYSREGAGAFLGSGLRVHPSAVPDPDSRAEYCYLSGRCLEESMDFSSAASAYSACETAMPGYRDAASRAKACREKCTVP